MFLRLILPLFSLSLCVSPCHQRTHHQVLGLAMAMYGSASLSDSSSHITTLEIAFLAIKGTALILSGVLILYSDHQTSTTTTTGKFAAWGTWAMVFLSFVLIELWCGSMTYRLTKMTAPKYIFDQQKVIKPSKLLVRGTLKNKMKYTLLPRILEDDAYAAGPPFLNADTSTTTPPPPSVLKGTLSMAMHVEVGSLDEIEKERGIAHFVEHLCFDASASFDSRYGIWQELDRLGVNANAFTSSRSTVYEHYDFVNDTKSIESVLKVAKEQLLYTTPTTKHINIEKGAVIGECRMRNDTAAILDDREAW